MSPPATPRDTHIAGGFGGLRQDLQDSVRWGCHGAGMTTYEFQPRLVVDDADAAIAFYVAALEAEELARFAMPTGEVVNADIKVGDQTFSLTEADGEVNRSPSQLGGTPMLLTLTVDDADAVGEAMVKAGATVVIPIDDRFYGRREGRIQDPSGHLWIVSQFLFEFTH